jgi:UDP-N-acetylglucosamine 3-dehydrogenase
MAKSKSRIRIGILGAGAMGSAHAAAYRAIDDVEVAGVFSRSRGKAENAARICGAKAFTDPMQLIDDPSIEAIDVCLPTPVHPEFVSSALKRGKHIFCETPFALRLEDAEKMIELARKEKRVLLVGLLMRSAAHYEHIKQVAETREHGKLLSVTTYRLGSYLRGGAADHKEHYSDPSTELMTFDFDFVQWLLGPPARVTATAATEREAPGEISALLDYGASSSATVLASGLMPGSFPFSAGFRVLFERGAFELALVFQDGPPKIAFTFFPLEGSPETVAIAGHDPFEKELRYFIACIRGEADPALLDAQRALEALKLSIATQLSLQEHRTVEVDAIRVGKGSR